MMRSVRGGLFAILVAAAFSAPAAAQGHVYARAPGDTLRYRMHSEARREIVGEKDNINKFGHDVRISLAFQPGDTTRAWFDSLRVMESGPAGELAAGPEGNGLPFVLLFGPLGVDTTLSAPDFPRSLDSLIDLRTQFGTLLPRLPGGPLLPGTTWTDTLVEAGRMGPWEVRDVYVTDYRVVGDSVIGGVGVVVVQLTGRLRGTAYHETGYDAVTEREESGRFYFAPEPGVLVRRSRAGVETAVHTARTPDAVTVVFRTVYSSRIELIPE